MGEGDMIFFKYARCHWVKRRMGNILCVMCMVQIRVEKNINVNN